MTEEPNLPEKITFSLDGFDPEDFPDKLCCGIPEYMILCGLVFPLEIIEDLVTKKHRLAVRFFEKDPRTLKPNTVRSLSMIVQTCPFCGEDIG